MLLFSVSSLPKILTPVCSHLRPERNSDEHTHSHPDVHIFMHAGTCGAICIFTPTNASARTVTHTRTSEHIQRESANSELELRSPSGKSHFPEHFTQFALLLAQSLSLRR